MLTAVGIQRKIKIKYQIPQSHITMSIGNDKSVITVFKYGAWESSSSELFPFGDNLLRALFLGFGN